MAEKLVFVVLSVLCFSGLGDCQNTNLTLFKISPCNEAVVDTVSRFKSDIYAVEFDLSNCSNVSSVEDDMKIVSLWW